MKHFDRRFLTTGIIIFSVIAILLIISPISFFSPMVTLGNSLYTSSSGSVSVQTKENLGNQTVMENFPKSIDGWEGYDYPVEQYLALLKADAMLVRVYEPPTFSQPIFFTIVQSKSDFSFHNPSVCFTAQGYKIQDEGQESVVITDTAWSREPTNITIPLNKLVATASNEDGALTERRLILYFYVKGNQFYSDTISMVQVDALIPLQGSYDDVLVQERTFLNKVIPLMFSPTQVDNAYHPIILTIIDWGVRGYIVIMILILIPAAVIFYPAIKLKFNPDNKP